MIKIGDTTLHGLTASYNGTVLTLKGKPEMSLDKLAALLSGNPTIYVIENGSTTAIYVCQQLQALTMETTRGELSVTVTMLAKSQSGGGGGGGTEDLANEIAEVRGIAEETAAALAAITEGIAYA